MQFSLDFSKSLIPDDLRSAYDDLVQNEVAAQGISAGVKALFDDEPKQLSFSFAIPKD